MSVLFCVAAVLVACGPARPSGQESVQKDGVWFREMPVKPLPALNVPRMAHEIFCVGDELLVVGGHTTGFIPTRTAEYLSGGKWHLVDLHYIHDAGFGVLYNGKPLVGGGYEGDFGIGQGWGTELYDPATHTFTHLPILDRKRTHVAALELEDGSVLVSGNWYAPDDMEIYTPEGGFRFIKEVSQMRSVPFMLKSAPDNALIFAANSHYGDSLKPVVIDRLKGEAFTHPLLEQWRPAIGHHDRQPACFEVGNYSYLIPVENRDGQVAAMLVSGESFSLLETEHPVPMQSPWGAIYYDCQFYTDRENSLAWLLGTDADDRIYLVKIAYLDALKGEKAPVDVYYTQPQEQMWWSQDQSGRKPGQFVTPSGLLLPDGRIAVVGGCGGSTYDPSPVACILCPDGVVSGAGVPWWLFVLGALLLMGVAALLGWSRLRKRSLPEQPPVPTEDDLHTRLVELMEQKQFFRRKDAKLSLVASELGTNVTYVSAMVNGTTGMSFPSFLNGYRVRYAQQLMQEHPEMPMKTVADESGFPNETTFFRNFKTQTGQTPSEWKAGL